MGTAVMDSGQRLRLARQAYQRAVANARARSTSDSWMRLVRAAKNLAEATEDVRRAHAGGNPRGGGGRAG